MRMQKFYKMEYRDRIIDPDYNRLVERADDMIIILKNDPEYNLQMGFDASEEN